MWALWETALSAVFQVAVGALSSVHSDGSVHVATSSGKLRANFHHNKETSIMRRTTPP